MRWQARIERGGRPAGTGFLIADGLLLTCAHVIGDGANIAAVFPGLAARPVVLEQKGDWDGSVVGVGDVALLRLAGAVDLAPARFATLNMLQMHGQETFETSGFPFAHPEGFTKSVRAKPRPLIRDAACQIDGTGSGVRLGKGFSGSAVYRGGSKQVVGMITSADSEADAGAMLPIETLVSYLPQLLDLIPLGPFSPPAYQDLNGILGGLVLYNPDGFYNQALGDDRATAPPPGKFAFVDAMSVLEAICEMDRDAGLIKLFTSRLLVDISHQLKSPELNTKLMGWIGQHALSFDQIQVTELPPAHIVTRIAPSATSAEVMGSRHVTMWTVQNEEFDEQTFDRSVPADHLQTEVEEQLKLAIKKIPPQVATTIVLEFVLPRGWLSWPVDEWIDLEDDDSWLGWSRPVVLRDMTWFNEGASRELRKRSETMNQSGSDVATLLRRRDCDHEQASLGHFKAWLRGPEQPLAVALAGKWAEEEWISAAVAAGVPVLVWPRHTCTVHTAALMCPGMRFTDALANRLASVQVHALAITVKELRAEAGPGGGEFHCGTGISLFLDNSDRRPPEAPLGYAKLG